MIDLQAEKILAVLDKHGVRYVLGAAAAVADLGDIVAPKEAAGREKDRAQLPAPRALQERLRQQRGD